jgi:hypothetical protein
MKNLSRILELITTDCDGWPGEPHKKAQDLILSGYAAGYAIMF